MSKILCSCGNMIIDQSDFNRYKAHLFSDQDIWDLISEIKFSSEDVISDKIVQYSKHLYQCKNCHTLILFEKSAKLGLSFSPHQTQDGSPVLESIKSSAWKGSLSGNYNSDKGTVYWNTNQQQGLLEFESLSNTREKYFEKFDELILLDLLRHSFLRIDGTVVHSYDCDQPKQKLI